MASIKIHRDLFNFERKRKGFTNRQIKSIVAGLVVMVATTAFLAFVIEIPFFVAIDIGLLPCLPVLLAGFLPLFGMPADEFAKHFLAIYKRGQVIGLTGEEVEDMKGETTREHKKASARAGYECRKRVTEKTGCQDNAVRQGEKRA